ncbi:MAG: hypothetical protein PVI23_11250 [Maricaulaceae bacterium]|jgi:hypothetical protein
MSKSAAIPVALGLRAMRGGAAAVGVIVEDGAPRVVLSSILATAADGDRLSQEPYTLAAEMPRGADGGPSAEAAAAVAEGRKRQDALAAQGFEDIVRRLRDAGREPIIAALLLNRAGWVTDLLSYSLAYADHPPVAEGLAVREALRFAVNKAGLELAEMDEKSLPDLASEVLDLRPAEIDARLKALGAEAGRPWRKEQKLACLAAWVSLRAAR